MITKKTIVDAKERKVTNVVARNVTANLKKNAVMK